MSLSTSAPKLIILGLTLLAFLLRAYRLDAQSYWIDEAWTIHYAHLSLPELWQALQTIRAAPPLYHILTIYWVKLVGDGEYALRFLSLFPSVTAIPLIYRLGRSLGDNRLGLIAALLLAIAPYQVWHAQDARNYSLLTAAAILSLWSFINLWRPRPGTFFKPVKVIPGGWGWWFLYVISTAGTVLTHYHGLIIIGVQGLFFLVTWRRHWRYYPAWASTLLIALLPLAAWLIFGSRLWQSAHWLPQVGLWDSYLRNAIAYSVGELVPRPQTIWLTSAFLIFHGFGLVYAVRRSWRSWQGWEMLAFLLIYTLAPNIPVWIYSRLGTSVYLERYLIPIQVGYLLAIAAGVLAILDTFAANRRAISRLPWPALGLLSWLGTIAALALFIGLSGWVLNHHYHDLAYAKENWRGVIRTIEALSLPGDAIVLTGDGGEKLFDYYYRGNLPVYASFNTPVPLPEEARRRLAEIAATHQRLWYTPYGVEIDAVLESWLAENSYPAWHSWLGRKRLALYDIEAVTDRQERLQARFTGANGQGLELIKAALPATATPAGDLLPLHLTWQTETPLTLDYQLSLRLVNNRGDIFAQGDWPPLAAHRPTSSWLPNQPVADRRSLWLPVDTPPGNYLLQLVIYNPISGEALGQPVTIPNILITPARITPPLEALSIPNPTSSGPPFDRRAGNLQSPTLNPLLVGYALPEAVQPGQELWLWLYWQAQAPLKPETTLQLSLEGEGGVAATSALLSDSTGPLDSWQPGQVRRAVYHLPTSPRLSGETAQVSATLASAQGLETEFPITQVKLAVRARQFDRPAIDYPLEVAFDNDALLKLVGYDLPAPPLAPGDPLPITLYWQAAAEIDTNYTVFVQVLDNAGQVVAQVDLPPQAGAAPTTTWLPGEILTDPYTLSLPSDLPAGNYRLITGLYNAATGERLPVSTGGNFVELGKVAVK
jgi:4-amino-4-deoxy-L-arabinose transferase-like glycosyltransferase